MRVLLRFLIGTLAAALLRVVLFGHTVAQEPPGAIPGRIASADAVALGDDSVLFNGDANCDGSIDSLDALVVLQFDAGLLDTLKHLEERFHFLVAVAGEEVALDLLL